MSIGILLEGLVAILLLVTVGYCFILNKRLSALRDGRDELKGLISNLSHAVTLAQQSISELKSVGDIADSELKSTVTKAKGLTDELSILIEVGNNLADRIADAPGRRANSNPPKMKVREARPTSPGELGSDGVAPLDSEDTHPEDLRVLQALKEVR